MNKWRICENDDRAPWRGGFGIEEIDRTLVPSMVCWFYRGWDISVVHKVIDLHNADVEKNENK